MHSSSFAHTYVHMQFCPFRKATKKCLPTPLLSNPPFSAWQQTLFSSLLFWPSPSSF